MNNTIAPGSKLHDILSLFARGERLHRFQAERLGDHTLNSTISDIQKRHRVYFQRNRIRVKNRFGSETSVMQYWLDDSGQERAKLLLIETKKSTQN